MIFSTSTKRTACVLVPVLVFLASCGDSGSRGGITKRATQPPPEPKVSEPEPKPTPPSIDLRIASITAPNRVNGGSNFPVTITVSNRSNTVARVANIGVRMSVSSHSGAINVHAGSGVVRQLTRGQPKSVTINARAPDMTGMGELHAAVKVLLAEDPVSANNKVSRNIVVN